MRDKLAIDLQTMAIADDVIFHMLEYVQCQPPTLYMSTMRRKVQEASGKYNVLYESMMVNMEVSKVNAVEVFQCVARSLFKDQECSWGCIVAVYTFAVHIAMHVFMDDGHGAEKFADAVGRYLATKIGDWVEAQGGWDGIIKFFPAPENISPLELCRTVAKLSFIAVATVALRH